MTANNFLAPTINVATLPKPNAVEELDVEVLLAQRMADFTSRAQQANFNYDVGELETDPIKIDQEVHSYRELLLRSRINSAVRAVLPAYAQGSDLDAIAARANVARAVKVPAEQTQDGIAILETDQELLVRYLSSFGAPAAGSSDGIIYRALTAYPGLLDVRTVGPKIHGKPGEVNIYLLVSGGEAVGQGIIDTVRAALEKPDAMPLTDVWTVGAAEIVPYTVHARLTVPRGPIPAEIEIAARAAIRAAADARYVIGANVWLDVLSGPAYVANVMRVELLSPLAPILTEANEAAYCTDINITIEVEE